MRRFLILLALVAGCSSDPAPAPVRDDLPLHQVVFDEPRSEPAPPRLEEPKTEDELRLEGIELRARGREIHRQIIEKEKDLKRQKAEFWQGHLRLVELLGEKKTAELEAKLAIAPIGS